MSVTSAPSSLQAILRQLDPAVPSRAPGVANNSRDAAVRPEAKPEAQRTAAAEPRVQVPKDAATLNPNAPRGSYLNLVV
tara:strand:- start:37640 stop:37876 length:237 start_codon:yes stop_codon:yes gene_type:complete